MLLVSSQLSMAWFEYHISIVSIGDGLGGWGLNRELLDEEKC